MTATACPHGKLRRQCELCDALAQIDQLRAQVERIIAIAESLQREPVQSRSVERRYAAQILDTAREALTLLDYHAIDPPAPKA